ncbi:MAG: universal stress protein [Mangrovicoccus sp.]|nr:universal stress protein [Mangrovicoccus sp.]
MIGAVLCALDISQPQHERPVLQRALIEAQITKSRLDVLTVVPDFGTSMVASFFPDNFQDKAIDETRKMLETFSRETIGAEADAEVRHLVSTGRVYEEVLRVAELEKAGLIVIGAHRPKLRDYLLGPNAARVVRHAACSVLVVR